MKVINKKIDEISPYENNPRINNEAVEQVANSIKEFGWQQPIVIDNGGVIIAGHTRYKAAMLLGYDEVPCVVADNLTEEQVKAYRLADNKVSEKAEWDFTKLDEELSEILDIDMEDFGFETSDINWDDVEDLSKDNYKEPTHRMLECPKCHHIDRDIHFKKIDEEE